MTDVEMLRAVILKDPCDNAQRLVYADALEDDGQTAYAEFVRLSLEVADESAEPCLDPEMTELDGLGRIHNVYTRKAPCQKCVRCRKRQRIHQLIHQLIKENYFPFKDYGRCRFQEEPPNLSLGSPLPSQPTFYLWRGFVESIRCKSSYWFATSKLLLALEPIRVVQLVDLPPYSLHIATPSFDRLLTLAGRIGGEYVTLGSRPIRENVNWVNKSSLKPIKTLLEAHWSGITFRFS